MKELELVCRAAYRLGRLVPGFGGSDIDTGRYSGGKKNRTLSHPVSSTSRCLRRFGCCLDRLVKNRKTEQQTLLQAQLFSFQSFGPFRFLFEWLDINAWRPFCPYFVDLVFDCEVRTKPFPLFSFV